MKKIVSVLLVGILIVSAFSSVSLANELDTESIISTIVESGDIDGLDVSTESGNNSNSSDKLTAQDFADAKFELNYSAGVVTLTISNVKNMNEDNKIAIKYSISSKANDDSYSQNSGNVTGDANKGTLTIFNVEKYLELNQDLYLNLFYVGANDNVTDILKSKKVERLAYPKYKDAFSASSQASHENLQLILTNIPKESHNTRTGRVKIGKITDTNILSNIKDNKEAGWDSLLSYAKSDNSSIYNKNLTCKDSFFVFKDTTGIGASQITDKAYYYLYVGLDDENGKYYPYETVTLAQSKVYAESNHWYMSFVGASGFNWDFSSSSGGNTNTTPQPTPTSNQDPTVAPSVLPNTGIDVAIVVAITGFAVAGVIGYLKTKKYSGIK